MPRPPASPSRENSSPMASPRSKHWIRKWRTAIFGFVLFASMMTVTYNSRQLKLTPEFLDQLTDLDSSSVFRNLQEKITETTDLMWDNTESLFGEYSSSGETSSATQQHATSAGSSSRHDDLMKVTRYHDDVTCPKNLMPVQMVANPQADAAVGRLIPKIVHITGKTKCLTDAFYHAAKLWQFENHSFYFHDDQAVDDLFNREWPMFPQLNNTITCLKGAGGAAKADLWRYLALYEYGGIYTDMDNHPNTLFNATSVPSETDAYFLQEGGGFLSQYFFAVSPKHPMMFLAVHDVMQQMHNLVDTGNFYVPVTSGPGSTKRAFLNFMGLNGTNLDAIAKRYSKPSTGHYLGVGFGNHSVTVFGNKQNNQEYVQRSAVKGYQKMQGWKQMGIENYQAVNKESNGKTCIRVLHEYYSAQTEAKTDVLREAYRRQRW